MKIAVIGAKGLPPGQGGIEHYCAEVYPRLVEAGHSVDFYARSSYIELPWFDEYDFYGVRVISLPSIEFKGVDAFLNAAMAAVQASRKQYDMIHFHALGPSLFTWLPRLSRSAAKIVVFCQGLDWQRAKWGKFSSKIILAGEQAAVRNADEIVVVSEALQQYFWETYNRKTTYIPNGAANYAKSDPEFAFSRSLTLEPGKYMVYLGRLVPEKCPDLLIKAFQQLQPQGWKLALVGGSSDTPDFQARLLELADGNPSILFTGVLRGKYLAEVIRGSGLFVLPSQLEGLPLAMLEAMNEGIPILGSDIPPHQQLLDQERGLMFATNDLEDCASQLAWAVDHPNELAACASRAQAYVHQNCSWSKIVSDNLALYERMFQTAAEPALLEIQPAVDSR
ncbi:MAG: glycosyltransferase family 4 protein [Synechococcales cyanobacterium CRU_2_2]|nr:glycosyltransferase family 4 protein [Synechococcales cyanobacterium CRU_2_2]